MRVYRGFIGVLLEYNHKTLGLYYTCTSPVAGTVGSIYSVVLRLELYGSGGRVISTENQYFYNLVFTLHGISLLTYPAPAWSPPSGAPRYQREYYR